MTSTFTDYVVTPEYWRDSVTAATPYTVDVIPQSVFDGLADVEAGRVAPMWAVMHLPAWLVRLVWFRRSNAEHEPRAIASRAPCSCSAISSEVKP
jgi:hypothetical protein